VGIQRERGFETPNQVQCSAARRGPEHPEQESGRELVFWGGSVDAQKTIHNVQARTPVEDIVAAIDAVHEFNGDG
jgi:hypothetical protein